MTPDPLAAILSDNPPPFALLYRTETSAADVDVLIGEVITVSTTADLPLTVTRTPSDLLAIVPFRQIAERGFECVDDGSPLYALRVTDRKRVPLTDLLARLPNHPITVRDGGFDLDDEEYERLVRTVVDAEIGTGEGANFVLKRTFAGTIAPAGAAAALSILRRLLLREHGAYWTFAVHTGDRTFVGASPERHITLEAGVAVMNPISGTFRYPPDGPSLAGILDFLADSKETDELYMVVDEELKMMARICDNPRVSGPGLKEMAKLAHTEYFIRGHTRLDPREILRQTMFAPTVTGSPLENACRVIKKYEPGGRAYYSGVVALFSRDRHGRPTLDSSILIRTAELDRHGGLRIGVGATIVRDSDPHAETAETKAKATALLDALRRDQPVRFGQHPRVRAALAERNTRIANFWLADDAAADLPALGNRRVLVVDAEDTFTAMLADQLRAVGLSVTVQAHDTKPRPDEYDLVVLGPGPGDPRSTTEPKIQRLGALVDELLDSRQPFLAICLSHQVLARRLGFDVVRRAVPNQGAQREILLFDRWERVGFYNTFVAVSCQDTRLCERVGRVDISRDPISGEVHALRGPHFTSIQFHAESVLSTSGVHIIAECVGTVLGAAEVLGA